MASFDYVRPATLAELLDGLRRAGSDGAVLAGGTDLLVKIRADICQPRVLFDLGELATCRQIVTVDGSLRIGAATRLAEVAVAPAVRDQVPALVSAIGAMSSRQIRNRATLGGNIVTASPAADAVPPLLAAGATVLLGSPTGQREIRLGDFLLGPGRTALLEGEVLLEIRVPPAAPGSRSGFIKIGLRRAQAISVINLAGQVSLKADGVVGAARIILGAVAPVALRARRAEAALIGRRLTSDIFSEVAQIAAEEVSPISDVRGTADGRRLLVAAWTLRLLQQIHDGSTEGDSGWKH